MSAFLNLFMIFVIGSSFGWVLELFFRRFFSKKNPERKWINPGFLVGPTVPLYGYGLCALYLLASLDKLTIIESVFWRRALLFLLMACCMTLIEFIIGKTMIAVNKVRLWDYSDEWGNLDGIICPKFSLCWAVLGAAYYFLVHPHIQSALDWLSQNLTFSFFLGLYAGILLVDFSYSAHVLSRVRAVAQEYHVVVRYQELMEHIRVSKAEHKEKLRFLLPSYSRISVREHTERFLSLMREKGDEWKRTRSKK